MIAANTSIKLGEHQAKKDGAVATGAPVLAANEVALYAPAGVSVTKTQTLIGDFTKLLRYAKSTLNDAPVVLSIPSGGSDASIQELAPVAGEVGLYIGSDIATKARSHALDSTFKKLTALWLEASK